MKKKQTLIAAFIFIALLICSLVALKLLSPDAVLGDKEITLKVNHLDGSNSNFEITTDAKYVRGALEPNGYISGKEDEYGLWVETVDGETADASKEQWWGYSINGVDALYGVDDQIISDGDEIEFSLNEGY